MEQNRVHKVDIPVLDIIIVNHNSTDSLIECLHSIKLDLNGGNAQIFVHDNASNDRPERIRHLFPYVSLTLHKINIGFAQAVNKTFLMSNSKLVMLLNPDTLIMNGFFKQVFEYFDKAPGVGIVGPQILEINGEIQGSARKFPTPLTTIFGRKSPITKIYPNNSITRKNILTLDHDGKTMLDVDWVSGACMIGRRDTFSKKEIFDERFFMYWEDTDLCKQIINNGLRVVYLPDAKVVHLNGKSSSTKPFFSIYHFHRSCYYLVDKHTKGIKRFIIPLAFCGLSFRCFVVMAHNRYQSLIRRLRAIAVRSNKLKVG